MPYRTAIAAAGGVVAGSVLTWATISQILEDPPDSLLLPLAVRIGVPTICALLTAGFVVRKWLDRHTEQIRSMIGEVVQQRGPVPGEAGAGPLDELPNRSSPSHLSGITVGLAVQLHSAEEKAERLQDDFDELAEDYNALVTDTLQQGADLFGGKSDTDPARLYVSGDATAGPVTHIGAQRTAGDAKPRRP
ncbi:hypothetical protein [Streptomyces sp. NBC_00120]|uniref:hypothetical protein n=1 Tax=Streptomyces sp. NBC_00120 TaxID=2975660 RepID=UPI002254A678|nr:hypothetical protein [Streptomyces sp. NBC_00120]MCX5326370.1 hypothetical protein [Streptomyces sp. NBC_00120]